MNKITPTDVFNGSEIRELWHEIKELEYVTGYEFGELEKLSCNYSDPNERQIINTLCKWLDMLTKIKDEIEYYSMTISYQSILHKQSDGRYWDGFGRYYTCGDRIEYLCTVIDEDEYPYWRRSCIEHDGDDYYIVGNRKQELEGLLIRVRQ